MPAAPEISARVQRLRDGTCARPECNYRFYRLILKKHPDVDWTKLLAPMATEPESSDPAQALCDATAARGRLHRASARRAVRVALVCAAAVVVLLARQWYLGGRIPLIREPELFRVDVAAEELLLDP